MVYLWAVCCIRLLVLNSSWALLVGFAEQQFYNAAPVVPSGLQTLEACCANIAEGNAAESARTHAGLMSQCM